MKLNILESHYDIYKGASIGLVNIFCATLDFKFKTQISFLDN